jgi:molybdopterin-guanine dinucleotide biosynthesis protein A
VHSGKPAGVILVGGRSSRMGGAHKALLELGGPTLLARVKARLQAHTDPLLLSCEDGGNTFEAYGLPVVADLLPGFRGPLSGLYSALRYLAHRGHDSGLVLCPCDAPFIPENLVQVLLDASQGAGGPVVVVSYQGELQPTFSLWQNDHLEVIQAAVVDEGAGGLKYVLKSLPYKVVEWAPSKPPPFFNVNTPADHKTAQMWLDHQLT